MSVHFSLYLSQNIFVDFMMIAIHKEVRSHCGFDLHFPDDQWYRGYFYVSVGHLYYLVWFSSKSFMVSGLAFNSLIQFEFIFVCGIESTSDRFFYMYLCSFPSTIYLKGCLFPTIHSCLLSFRLINHTSVALFLGPLFCSTDLLVSFGFSAIPLSLP